jgi:hypothetical protein
MKKVIHYCLFLLITICAIKVNCQTEATHKNTIETKVIGGGIDGLSYIYGIQVGYGRNLGRNFILKPNIVHASGGQKRYQTTNKSDGQFNKDRFYTKPNARQHTAQIYAAGLMLQRIMVSDKNASLVLGIGAKYARNYTTDVQSEFVVDNQNNNYNYLVPNFNVLNTLGVEVEIQYKHQISEKVALLGSASMMSELYMILIGVGAEIKF